MGRLDQADIPVFLLSGNHDAESVLTRSVPWPPNVRVFGTRRPETHTLPELAVAVHGQSFATPAVTDNLERLTQWRQKLDESGLNLEIENAIATLDVLDELRAEIAAQTSLNARLDGMIRDADEHDSRVAAAADALGIPAAKETSERLSLMRSRLTAARSTATALDALQATVSSHYQEMASEEAKLTAALDSLEPLMKETGAADIDELACAIERSRAARALRAAIADTETAIKSAGDGKCLEELLDSLEGVDPDGLAARTQNLSSELADLNAEVDQAAAAHGDARRAFATLEQDGESAVDAASDADQARAELAVLSEQYILKRAEAVSRRDGRPLGVPAVI